MPTIVVDTNTLVSATLSDRTTPRRAVVTARASGLLIASAGTLAELDRVVRRQKFDRYASLDERLRFLTEVLADVEVVTITERVAACRDPKDDKFLELAVNGRATHLVTGDADLLALHPFRGVAILTAADFVAASGA